jgi:hypothetical protein
LYRKGPGKETKLSYCGHVTMEHRNGLVVQAMLTQATGRCEREAALKMMKRIKRRGRVTMAGDKGYNVREFVTALREMNVTPHVAHKKNFNAIDGRTTRHPGYEISQRARKRVEEIFDWTKTIGTFRKTKQRGSPRVGWMFHVRGGLLQLGENEESDGGSDLTFRERSADSLNQPEASRAKSKKSPRQLVRTRGRCENRSGRNAARVDARQAVVDSRTGRRLVTGGPRCSHRNTATRGPGCAGGCVRRVSIQAATYANALLFSLRSRIEPCRN